jgi:hypothetical protein
MAASWPEGKRIAILVSILLENWSEGRSPTYFPRTTALKSGAIDHAGIEWSHYGGREGVWRLMRVLERANVKATVFANALSLELPRRRAPRLRPGTISAPIPIRRTSISPT